MRAPGPGDYCFVSVAGLGPCDYCWFSDEAGRYLGVVFCSDAGSGVEGLVVCF